MRSNLKKLVSAVVVAGAFATAPAHAFLQDWYLARDGVTKTQINEFLDIVGPSVVTTTAPVAGAFTFSEVGGVNIATHDGATPFLGSATAQIAALFDAVGNANLGGNIFYTGGTINMYANATQTAATGTGGALGTYGINPAGSTLIGTFTPVSGGGTINPTGIPNGVQTISALATFLQPGYFFAPDGTTDLSTIIGGNLLFGFATTNASFIANAPALVEAAFGTGGVVADCLPGFVGISGSGAACTGTGNFEISNNGQFRLQLPEPGSLALLGIALFGVGVARRRKV